MPLYRLLWSVAPAELADSVHVEASTKRCRQTTPAKSSAAVVGLREDLEVDRFIPQRMRDKAISKASGKVRRLGIPRTASRVVQVIVNLALEPIFEADFQRCSYGFRPSRGAQDAIAEIHFLASPSRNYNCVFATASRRASTRSTTSPWIGRVRERVGKNAGRGPVPSLPSRPLGSMLPVPRFREQGDVLVDPASVQIRGAVRLRPPGGAGDSYPDPHEQDR